MRSRFPTKPLILILSALALAACDPAVTSVSEDVLLSEPLAEVAIVPEPIVTSLPSRRPVASANPRRGIVTAGDIDDGLNLAAFQRYHAKTARDLKLPRIALDRAFIFRVMGKDGAGVAGVPFTLRKPGAPDPFHRGHTGIDGRVVVFPQALGAGALQRAELRLFGAGQTESTHQIRTGRTEALLTPHSAQAPDFLDLVFVIDTTGSMGDELAWLTREFMGIVRDVRRAAPDVDMRFLVTAYRDHGDAYVVRRGWFQNARRTLRDLRKLDASGGGDYPEAAAEALRQSVNASWRRGSGKRILIHIADAPPHRKDAKAYLDAARDAAKRDIRIYGLGASGVAAESEFLMRQAAVVTGGRYMFLTDDSGVGNAHAEPTIDCYRVTALASLLRRVLQSELTGRRIEAAPGDVIRKVGAYQGGICRQ